MFYLRVQKNSDYTWIKRRAAHRHEQIQNEKHSIDQAECKY